MWIEFPKEKDMKLYLVECVGMTYALCGTVFDSNIDELGLPVEDECNECWRKVMGKMTNRPINSTPKAKKLKKCLEAIGEVNVEVWWEPVTKGCEMGGPEGGWFFVSDEISIEPLGYSYDEAWESIRNGYFQHWKRETTNQ